MSLPRKFKYRHLFLFTASLLGFLVGSEIPTARVTAAPVMPASIHKVGMVTDKDLDAASRYGIAKLTAALRKKGVTVSEDAGAIAKDDVVIVAGLTSSRGPAASVLDSMKVAPPTGTEALTIRKAARYKGKPAILLAGGGGVGLMYAALDMADRVEWSAPGTNPLQSVRNADEKPMLRQRGVVMFTMNQAYFESRFLDEKFWERYFAMLADDRINQLVLTFGYEDGGYMAPLYPYFFDVEGFPEVKVVGMTPDQQTRNRNAMKTMLKLASERGIHVKAGIWEHIYRGGGQRGANSWASDGTKPTAGLVWGLDGKNLGPYTVAALRKFYDTFPEIAETQFRMHDESGLRQPEIEPFWHDLWAFFKTSEPKMPIEMRAKGLSRKTITDAQEQGLTVNLDTKIWMEQMGLPYHPTQVNREDQNNARHGYADLLEYPQTYKMDWTLWNGGTQRLLVWADPDYARRMAKGALLYNGDTMAVTEMEATKLLGEPHNTPPRDFLNAKYRYFDWEFERYWAFYRMWGRLMYNPDTPADVWDQEYVNRFGPAAAPHVMKAVQIASTVLPHVVASSYLYSIFPTTTGWPEMQHMGGLPQFADREEPSDVAQFMSVKAEAASIIQGTDTALRRPEEISYWFSRTSDEILAEVAAAESSLKGNPSRLGNPEFKSTMTDAKILAAMARYHAARQLGGVSYELYKQAGDLTAFDAAIEYERKAVQAWSDIVTAAGDFYIDNMSFGPVERRFPHHWKDELILLRSEFDQLTAERAKATGKPGVKPMRVRTYTPSALPPAATLLKPSASAVPARDFQVNAKVSAPAGVKTISLRYRHVNQHENYETAPMTRNPRTGLYSAAIPGAYINTKYDLMYFVEIVDQKGSGRIYPNLDTETPYVMVPVAR